MVISLILLSNLGLMHKILTLDSESNVENTEAISSAVEHVIDAFSMSVTKFHPSSLSLIYPSLTIYSISFCIS